MSKNSNETWNTKYGKRRVRDEKPTLAEAIEAARGFIDDLDQQAEFAAALMGLPIDKVRAGRLRPQQGCDLRGRQPGSRRDFDDGAGVRSGRNRTDHRSDPGAHRHY